MIDVINGVPRELLELLTDAAEHGTGINTPELMQARALLTAQPQASAAQSAPAGAVPEGYRWYLVPKEDTDAFNAACSAANDAYLGGVGPCGVFIAGYRALLAAAPAQPAAQREWPDDEIVAAWKWCEENGGTPAEFLSHSLLVKRSRVLGRPLTWREAIELTAITTNMPDEERDKLLAIDDEPDAAAQDQGEVRSEWLLCSDSLPADKRDVLVYCADSDEHMVGSSIGGGLFLFATASHGEKVVCRPTHWRYIDESDKPDLAASTGQEV